MNLLHLKYAVEIEKTRSISKAAENLFMAQPNLSRAIKELEESLGIEIFRRTSKGMSVTTEGEEFLSRAKKILAQVDEVENYYKHHKSKQQRFSISVPRATYISAAFAEFVKQIDSSLPCEIYYKETNADRAIRNILQSGYNLGIIRYQRKFDGRFKSMLAQKGLEHQLITEFSHVVVMSKDSPLALKQVIDFDDLEDWIEIAHADPFVPTMSALNIKKEELVGKTDKRIFVFERGSQLDLLRTVPNTYVWCSPVPRQVLERYGLIQLECNGERRIYKDMLIYPKGYNFSDLDNLFITQLCDTKREFS